MRPIVIVFPKEYMTDEAKHFEWDEQIFRLFPEELHI